MISAITEKLRKHPRFAFLFKEASEDDVSYWRKLIHEAQALQTLIRSTEYREGFIPLVDRMKADLERIYLNLSSPPEEHSRAIHQASVFPRIDRAIQLAIKAGEDAQKELQRYEERHARK